MKCIHRLSLNVSCSWLAGRGSFMFESASYQWSWKKMHTVLESHGQKNILSVGGKKRNYFLHLFL